MNSKKKYLKDKLIEFYSQLKCDCDAYIGWNYSEVYEKKFIEQIKLKFQTEKKKIPKQLKLDEKTCVGNFWQRAFFVELS